MDQLQLLQDLQDHHGKLIINQKVQLHHHGLNLKIICINHLQLHGLFHHHQEWVLLLITIIIMQIILNQEFQVCRLLKQHQIPYHYHLVKHLVNKIIIVIIHMVPMVILNKIGNL
ncbi:hypothetical protein BCR32DRAFT_77149 [Anaeromyces robustus]|uniref:Uncharacterized protein n=1 Tax=Anaeromyces robustus TaxID=1754192 RepID=A0A1Y1XQC8_9FUNG|nr:hypothetical protein BCR32DRAFT_77149 [Anaeromyces robustus]|eukprot:ORX87960.1 hypothetical protein BCR32DRAFT_77149 [Anaeromyces robustus]